MMIQHISFLKRILLFTYRKFHFSFYGSLMVNWGSEESSPETGTGLKSLFRESYFLSDIYGGAGVTVSLFSFYLGFGPGISLGYINSSEFNRDPLLDTESTSAWHYFLFGVGADIWVGWMITEDWSVNLKWSIRPCWPIGAEKAWENHLLTQITFSLGYRLIKTL